MAFDISYIFQAIDKFTRPARDILRSTKALQAGMTKLNAITKFGAELQRKNMFIMAGTDMAIAGLAHSVLGTAATFQQLRMSFGAMLGSVKQGNALFKKMKNLSQEYGTATTEQLSNVARMFLSVGGSASKIPKVMGWLLDVSALSTVSIQRLGQSYQKAFGEGRLTRRILRPFLNNTKLLITMAKLAHKSVHQMGIILGRGGKGLPFKLLPEALRVVTSKGHTFWHGQIIAAKTMRGAWKRVADALQILTDHIGEYLSAQFKLVPESIKLQKLMQHISKNFDSYAKRYGWMVTGIIKGLLAFAALVTFNFLLGTVLRTLELVTISYTAIMKLATVATWLWGSVIKKVIFVALWPFKIALLRVSEALSIAAMGGTAFDIAMALLPLIIAALVVGLVLLLHHFKLLKPALKDIGMVLDMTLIKPLEIVINLIKKAIPAFKKLESLMKPFSKIEFPFAKLGQFIGSKIPVFHHTITKMVAATTPMAGGAMLNFGPPHMDIVSALQQAFPNLNEGLKTLVNVHINGKESASTEHTSHASGSPYFDIGLNMPLSGGV